MNTDIEWTRFLESDRRSSLEVVLDVLGVVAVEPLQLLVELHVALVDVVDVGVGVVAAAPAELVALVDLEGKEKS